MAANWRTHGDPGPPGSGCASQEIVRADAFCARHGFEQVGRKQFRIGDRFEDDFVRERPL